VSVCTVVFKYHSVRVGLLSANFILSCFHWHRIFKLNDRSSNAHNCMLCVFVNPRSSKREEIGHVTRAKFSGCGINIAESDEEAAVAFLAFG